MTKNRLLAIGAIVVGLFGLMMRLHLLRTPAGALNADEAYTGLQSLAILRGDLPIVIRGAGYTAVLDSYFFAPFVWIFGAHVVPLKLLSSLWWSGAAVLMYVLAKHFVGRTWGLLAASMVWVAPGALMLLSTRAYEAYGLGLLVSLLTAFATTQIVKDPELPRRWVMIAGAGAGLAFYLHPMFIAAALPMMLVPCWIHVVIRIQESRKILIHFQFAMRGKIHWERCDLCRRQFFRYRHRFKRLVASIHEGPVLLGGHIPIDVFLIGVVFLIAIRSSYPLPTACVTRKISIK